MGADRHDGILMSLLVQLTETIIILNFFFEKLGAAKISNIPKGQWKEIFNIINIYRGVFKATFSFHDGTLLRK